MTTVTATYRLLLHLVLQDISAKKEEVTSMQNIYLSVDDRMGADKTLRKFKRLCDSYGIVKEYRTRQDYKKPSVKRKEKLENAEKRRTKEKKFKRFVKV